MHSTQRIGPATKIATDPSEIWVGIERFAERLAILEAAGVTRDRLIIDPGWLLPRQQSEPSLTALADPGLEGPVRRPGTSLAIP